MIDSVVQMKSEAFFDVNSTIQISPKVAHGSLFWKFAVLAILFPLVLVAFARWRTGSFAMVPPYLAGQRLIFETTQHDVGVVKLGTESVDICISILNSGSKDLQLLGAHRSCGCISLDEFPLVIPANSVKNLKVSIGLPTAERSFSLFIKFFSDDSVKPFEKITISGSVK